MKPPKIIDLLPNKIIESFISARAPQNPKDRVPLELVSLITPWLRRRWQNLATSLAWFRADTRSLRVENQFDFIGD